MLQRYCFQFVFSAVLNRFKHFQNAFFRDIVFIFFSAVPNRFNDRQASECTIYRPCFQFFFSAVPNLSKYRQYACLRDIVFKMFSAVPKSFQIPSVCKLQRHCFYNVLCSSKSFQLYTVRMHTLETLCFDIRSLIVSNPLENFIGCLFFIKIYNLIGQKTMLLKQGKT